MAKNFKGQTTKDFVEVADIREDIVILKDGSLRTLIEATSINFDLKSNDEQIAILQGFQDFLNSVDFPLQICISSRKLDIMPYLKSLDQLQDTIKSELLKIQLVEYSRFIKGLTELANIMSKGFFVVVPFYAIETSAGGGGGLMDKIKSIFSPSKFITDLNETNLQNYKVQINQRVEVISGGLNSLGIGTKVLAKDDLIKVFYSFYNPGTTNVQENQQPQ